MRALLIAISAFVLSGCGNLQALKLAEVPPQLRQQPVQLSSTRPAAVRVSPGSIEVPGHSVYLKQTAGGSLAVGLLFGPLGVMANAANIERLTNELKEASKGSSLLQTDALEEASVAWSMAPASPDAKSLQLMPYVILYPDDDRKNVTVIAGAEMVAPALPDGVPWGGIYNHVLATPLGFDALQKPMTAGALEAFRQELREAFRQVLVEVRRDQAPRQPPRKLALIWAPALKATLMGFAGFASGDVETDASGRLVIRSNMGNWGGTVGAATKDAPHYVWIFPKPSQYRFDAEPVERKPQ